MSWRIFATDASRPDFDRLSDEERAALTDDLFGWVESGPPRANHRVVGGLDLSKIASDQASPLPISSTTWHPMRRSFVSGQCDTRDPVERSAQGDLGLVRSETLPEQGARFGSASKLTGSQLRLDPELGVSDHQVAGIPGPFRNTPLPRQFWRSPGVDSPDLIPRTADS